MTPPMLSPSPRANTPEPADSMGEMFDLAGLLVIHPFETFYVRVSGDSLVESGIFDGDILVVDRAIEPRPQDIVVADTGNGSYMVRQFTKEYGRPSLVSVNSDHHPNNPTPKTKICGVARFAIHRL